MENLIRQWQKQTASRNIFVGSLYLLFSGFLAYSAHSQFAIWQTKQDILNMLTKLPQLSNYAPLFDNWIDMVITCTYGTFSFFLFFAGVYLLINGIIYLKNTKRIFCDNH